MIRHTAQRWLAATLLAGFGLCGSAAAQPDYPANPVRLVVPFSTGGGNDIVARMLARHLGDELGQTIIVENRPGAGGNIGMASVARAAPDGYTLAYVANTVVINPYLYKDVGSDIRNDFAPVANHATSPVWVLVHPSLPARSLGELIAYGKANPGKLSYATPGVGTPHHMAAELLKVQSGLDMMHVPYKGASGAATDVVGGQVPVLIATPASVQGFVAAGQLRPLATMDAERSAATPELPTVNETVPGFDTSIWHGIVAPARTDPAVVDRLAAAIEKILKESSFSGELASVGFSPAYEGPDAMGERIARELAMWADAAGKAGIRPE
ncbi:tripartite tricarboxylate transporter substrate binding protein [Verticiella sediminum]|uniref:Tripartite tricarboxylate transporter substrate binding protein n=1 Tax=Verticiella sediminum TaxID=1247510 RepID=A0A556AWJ5_9BURK|nr:tripartite tricarboxylate transporter substrate binding protein [Verticiella sediminum]TSH97323.1 tripartite tricarboxylate transporter substrate binding protein [Verticiella sediminum]